MKAAAAGAGGLGREAGSPPWGAPHNEFWVNSKQNDLDFGQISDVKSEGEN